MKIKYINESLTDDTKTIDFNNSNTSDVVINAAKDKQEDVDNAIDEVQEQTDKADIAGDNKVVLADEITEKDDLEKQVNTAAKRALKEDIFETEAGNDFVSDVYNALADVMFRYRNQDIDETDVYAAAEFFIQRFFE